MKPVKPKPLSATLRKWLEERSKVGIPKRGRTVPVNDARAILAALEHERQKVDALLRAGAPLSNVAFNLKQNGRISEADRLSCETAQRMWDETVRKVSS